MSGFVTERRVRDKHPYAMLSDGNGGNTPVRVNIPDRQETYSFRSGSRAPSEDESLRQTSDEIRSSNYVTARSYKSGVDTGHEFHTTRVRCLTRGNPVDRTFRDGSWNIRYQGPLILQGYGVTQNISDILNLMPQLSPSQVTNYGARAISATAPTAPNASLINFLIELKRDGIPALLGASRYKAKHDPDTLWGHRTGLTPRSTADEFLNVQFGWMPLASDLKKLLQSISTSSAAVQQMRRDSGRKVRRRFHFPVESQILESEIPHNLYNPPLAGLGDVWAKGASPTHVTDSVRHEVWFSGAYCYYLDPGDTLMGKFQQHEQLANKLLGTRLNASALWEAMPWSWLVDWFTDVGSVLDAANLLSEDGLVIRHGYLMRRTTVLRTMKCDVRFGDPTNRNFSVTTLYSGERKERVRATPYGFSLLPQEFSSRQWAILAALGLTKSPRQTW